MDERKHRKNEIIFLNKIKRLYPYLKSTYLELRFIGRFNDRSKFIVNKGGFLNRLERM